MLIYAKSWGKKECFKVLSSMQEQGGGGEKKLKMYNCTGDGWRGVDVLVKNQERASAEQVTLFLTSQPHQKFFQVSFCVAKDDNGESISA